MSISNASLPIPMDSWVVITFSFHSESLCSRRRFIHPLGDRSENLELLCQDQWILAPYQVIWNTEEYISYGITFGDCLKPAGFCIYPLTWKKGKGLYQVFGKIFTHLQSKFYFKHETIHVYILLQYVTVNSIQEIWLLQAKKF